LCKNPLPSSSPQRQRQFPQNSGKIYQIARRHDLHDGGVAGDAVVVAVVVTFPEGERYEMPTPFVFM